MKYIISIVLFALLVSSCEDINVTSVPQHENFAKRTVDSKLSDSLKPGKTYLSAYSQIYSISEHKTHNLTVTASIRNISLKDTVYITKAEYFDTHATLIHTYFDKPVYVGPLETLEIVIDEVDQSGGTGANFIFDWKTKPQTKEPFFEGIMISTYGTQGLSFTTQGIRIE